MIEPQGLTAMFMICHCCRAFAHIFSPYQGYLKSCLRCGLQLQDCQNRNDLVKYIEQYKTNPPCPHPRIT